jgi:hypothetical protein
VAGALQEAQQHDADEAADMQAGGGEIDADLGGEAALREQGIQRIEIRALMHESARDRFP